MLPFEDRYSRQRRLAQVGQSGQRRLEQTRAIIFDEPGHAIAREYLSRAGVRVLTELGSEPPAEQFAHAGAFRHLASRGLAQGSWRALSVIKAALAQSALAQSAQVRGDSAAPQSSTHGELK